MAAATSSSSHRSSFASRTDLKPYQEKLLAVLKRDEAQLAMTIAGDLPRLAKLITIKDTDKRPMFTLPIEEGDTWTHVRAIIFTLLDLVEQETNKVSVDDFNEYFQIGREIPERMAAFLKRIGGATSNTYRVLSACNQAATAAAVIELKTTLGFSNATTDMANSWRFDIVLSKEYVEVHNMKREQMQKVFEFEWQFVVRFAVAEMEVTDVRLLVTDLVFSQEAPPAQIQDVCQRLDHLMVSALRDDLTKSGCFASEAAKSGGLTASSSSNSFLDSNYVKTGFMRKVGGKRKKPGNWQRRWFALADDGCLYYYKQSPEGAKKRPRPAGCLDLKSSTSVTCSDEVTKKMNTFAIDIPDRTYYLQCTTYEECREWVGALSKFLQPSAHVDPSLGLTVSAPPPASPSKKSSAIMSRRKSGSSTWSKALLPRRPRVNTVFGEEHSGAQQVFSECIEGDNESIPFPGILLRGPRQPIVSLSLPKEQVTDERIDASPRDGDPCYPVEASPRARQELTGKGTAVSSASRKKFNSLEPRAFSAVRNKNRMSVTIERTRGGTSPVALEELEFLRTRNLELERLLKEARARNDQLEETVASLNAQLQLLAAAT